MQVVPYLYFNGNADKAVQFYCEAFQLDPPNIMRFKDQPYPGMPEALNELILHTELNLGGEFIYISDSAGPDTTAIGSNVQININCDSEEQILYIFDHMRVGGKVTMELEDTFWGALFGSLKDPFDIHWSFNYQRPGAVMNG